MVEESTVGEDTPSVYEDLSRSISSWCSLSSRLSSRCGILIDPCSSTGFIAVHTLCNTQSMLSGKGGEGMLSFSLKMHGCVLTREPQSNLCLCRLDSIGAMTDVAATEDIREKEDAEAAMEKTRRLESLAHVMQNRAEADEQNKLS